MDRPGPDRAVSTRPHRACGWLAVLAALWMTGCSAGAWRSPSYTPPEIPIGPFPPQNNPAVVGVMDRDFVWEQVVDVVDDYFRVKQEDRVRLVGDLLTEGRLETYPRSASTIFEPWNKDSSTAYERWESTLQSMRRTAIVRVIPDPAGFAIDVQVYKELENVPRPETGAVTLANSAALRNDNSLQRVTNPVMGIPPSAGWIPQGRDTALEQRILAHVQSRLIGMGPPRAY